MPDQLSKNIEILRNQNLLLGITYRIMAVALSKDPWCLEELEEDKVRKVSMLSGEKPDSPEKVKETPSFFQVPQCCR